MSERNFRQLLEAQWERDNFVCVGLDSELSKIPKAIANPLSPRETIFEFNRHIVDATKDLVCAYKPNIAFYEAEGEGGLTALRETIIHIHAVAPEVPVILDAKRADIGSTNAGYVKMAFETLGADAITVHPYLGAEALQPFLERADKGIFVLCRTSNPGAGEFQDLHVIASVEDERRWGFPGDNLEAVPMTLYKNVAYRVAYDWNKNGNCGVVVGATCPEELQEVRDIVGDMPILIPGIGAQGGDVEETVSAGKDSRGRGMIMNSSRGIIFASNGPDFAEAARRETIKLRDRINQYR